MENIEGEQPLSTTPFSSATSVTPSGLPLVSFGFRKKSPLLTAEYVGFVCCNNTLHHSLQGKTAVLKSQPVVTQLDGAFNARQIKTSLRYESQMRSAIELLTRLSTEQVFFSIGYISKFCYENFKDQ